MLNQKAFEAQHQSSWDEIGRILNRLESRRFWKRTPHNIDALPQLYASLCQQHAMAQSRGYSHDLTSQLHSLIARAHHQLYKHRGGWLRRTISFIGGGFAQHVRNEAKLMALCCCLFFGIGTICALLSATNPEIADLLMGSEQRRDLEYMYRPDTTFRSEERESSSKFMMYGFYIFNNISIDFQTFASGILFGVGTLFILVFNAIVIGAASGYLTGIGYIDTFWGFVAGHSAPELLAVCISAVAGLMLGRALIKPGNQSRRLALLREAKAAVPLILGAGLMTFMAAFIEAYWSPLNYPLAVKASVGITIWVAFICYFCFAGRKGSIS
jgi:uncharacterized membrane protein SpoIIM required for sporulation